MYSLQLRSHYAVISLRINLSRYIPPGYRCTSTHLLHFHFRFANHLVRSFPALLSLVFSLVLDPSSSPCKSSPPHPPIHVFSSAPRLSLPSWRIPGPLAALFLIIQCRMTVDCTDPPSNSHTIPPLLSLQNPYSFNHSLFTSDQTSSQNPFLQDSTGEPFLSRSFSLSHLVLPKDVIGGLLDLWLPKLIQRDRQPTCDFPLCAFSLPTPHHGDHRRSAAACAAAFDPAALAHSSSTRHPPPS